MIDGWMGGKNKQIEVCTDMAASNSINQAIHQHASDDHSSSSSQTKTGEKTVEMGDGGGYLTVLNQMREAAQTRQFTRAQSEVVELAFLKYNLLLRGPANCGKRFIARCAGDLLGMRRRHGQKVEIVEVMAKWFTVTPNGQPIIDEASLSIAKEQIQRATVLIIENVPCHPQAAAAFFAHLDFYCRAERCNMFNGTHKSTLNKPSQSSFGGIQIIATQNDIPDPDQDRDTLPLTQVLWARTATTQPFVNNHNSNHNSNNNNLTTSTTACGGSGPAAPTKSQQMGILVTTAATPTANPHPDVFVLLFR
jgi:hypothetical protein